MLLLAVSVSTAAYAQDDEDVVPLPVPGKAKPKPAAKPAPAPAKPAAKPAPAKPAPTPEEEAEIAPLPTGPGTLVLKLPQGVPDANWSLDGRDQGAITAKPLSLDPGEHVVVVKRPGYANFVKKVTVLSGKNTELPVALQATYALVSVSSNVPEAGVYVDGRFMGVTPLKDLELNPGTTEISVRKEGYKEDRQTLNLVAGRAYPLSVKFIAGGTKTLTASSDAPKDVSLTPDSTSASLVDSPRASDGPVTSKWYFWAGVVGGVVAVTVAIIVIAALSAPKVPTQEEIFKECDRQGQKCVDVLVLPTIVRSLTSFSFP